MSTVLEIKNASFLYGMTKALDDVSFEVKKGETFGMIGPDGAGKTTLIRLFCGLLKPSSGNCTVLGSDTVKDKYQLIPKIGYLSQKFSLYTDMTVSENINFFADIHKVRNYSAKKNELLEFTGLSNFKDRLAGALSGGMKQKLALSCTLIHTPEIIFLDEPTNGVDPVARRDFWKILKDISKQGVSIIISTPYIDEAEKCDRVAFMNRGSLIACDTPAGVKSRYRYKLFEIVSLDVQNTKTLLEKCDRISTVQIFGNTLHAGTERSEDDSFIKDLAGKVEGVMRIKEIKPSLEDVFIDLLENRNSI